MLLLVLTGALAAFAVVVPPANSGGIVAVGPVSGDNGFPVWYKDSNGLRLEGCLDGADPLCGFAAGGIPDPTRPISFPDNFPEEFFYQLASNVQDGAGGAGRATTVLALEGAFGSGPVKAGDQVVFARIRFRLSPLQPGATYRITHPFGVDDEVADATGAINFTEDVGLAPGIFTGALDGRVGPFLQWDPAVAPAAPVGFVGDPAVDHPVVGSPFTTNFVRVDGPGLAVIGNQSNLCSSTRTDCIQSNLFSLLGKKATRAGFDIQRSAYSRSAGTGGTSDFFASSDTSPQSIQIEGQGFDPVLMRGENGNYVSRIQFTGAPFGQIPVRAFAGEDQEVLQGTTVTLDGTGSTGPITSFSWTQTAGPAVTLGGADTATPTFTAPAGDATLEFELTVNGTGGPSTDRVVVNVLASAKVPIADAGPDQTVNQTATVHLTGTGSRSTSVPRRPARRSPPTCPSTPWEPGRSGRRTRSRPPAARPLSRSCRPVVTRSSPSP